MRLKAWRTVLAVLAVPFVVSACGGGSGASPLNPGTGTGSGGGTGGGGGGTVEQQASLTLRLVDSDGNPLTTLPTGAAAEVVAVVKDAAGVAVEGRLVTFTTESQLATFTPALGTAATDATGTARILLQSAGVSASGAGVVTAVSSVPVSGGDPVEVKGQTTYVIGQASVTVSPLTPSTVSIPAYGTTTLQITVNVNGVPTPVPTPVTFTSGCFVSGKAVVSDTVQTVNGVASTTYTDRGCGGADTVTATAYGQSKTAVVTSASAKAANVQFVGATPQLITVKGTGTDISTVLFKVVDASGQPVAAKKVTLGLTTRIGGILLDETSSGTVVKDSAADGTVTANVQAGSIPASVWVTAELVDGGATVTTQSSKLVISTGLPTQDRFSMSANVHNVEGWQYDGVEATINILAADRVGNYVPDGTTVNFISEGASVEGSCQMVGGACSVTFRSQNFRPDFIQSPSLIKPDPSVYEGSGPFPPSAAGRVTVLAYANGEESFDDVNSDNVRNDSEAYRDLGDIYVDFNENSVHDSGEQDFPFNQPGVSLGACPLPPVDGRYKDALSKAGTCDGKFGRSQVRRHQVMVLSGSFIEFAYPVLELTQVETGGRVLEGSMDGTCNKSFKVRLADLNYNPLPAGTVLSIPSVMNGVQYVNEEGKLVKAAINVIEDSVRDTTIPGGTSHSFLVVAEKCVTVPEGSVDILATTPKGNKSTVRIRVRQN